MKVSELRIGNWVHVALLDGSREKDRQVNSNDFDCIDRGWLIDKPIPLTEEWLLKLGMQEHVIPPHWSGPKERRTFYRNDDAPVNLLIEDGVAYICFTKLCEVKYVHQLQNLYFALTGEELTLK